MNIKFNNNSIRCRLTKTDIHHLKEHQVVTGKTTLSGDQAFHFILETSEVQGQMEATSEGGSIKIAIPRSMANTLTDTDQIGIEGRHENDGENSLFIRVEKDLKCSDDSSGDQSDRYDRPAKKR